MNQSFEIAIAVLFLFLNSANQDTVSMYKGYLLKQHNKAAPPDGVVHVGYDLELVNILEVNELKQRISVLLYIEETWFDKTLSWTPKEFENLTKTWLPEGDVWLPDILIFNMLQHENLLHSVRSPVLIHYDGKVVFTFPAVYTVMCEMDIKDFPLDSQECALEVASWEYGEQKLQLIVSSSNPLDHYAENEEWQLKNVSIDTIQYHHEDFFVSEIFFNIRIKRKPLFYMCNLVLPSFIITSLSIIGLFAPSSTSSGERKEKFTLGVTAILTMSVLLLLVSEKVPHSSKSVPLLVVYFMVDILLITGATAVTALIVSVHKKQADSHAEIPRIFKFLFLLPNLQDPSEYYFPPDFSDEDRIIASECSTEQKAAMSSIIEMLHSINSQTRRIKTENHEIPRQQVQQKNHWVILARRLDFLFLSLFLAGNTAFTMYLVLGSL